METQGGPASYTQEGEVRVGCSSLQLRAGFILGLQLR